jgi:sugar phosphate isomerase/epimerase
MKASISAWSYRAFLEKNKMDLFQFIDEVKRLKADGFEIFPFYIDKKGPGGHLKEIARKAKKLRLSISAVIACNDFACPTAAARAEQIERVKQWIAWTAEAGIGCMNTFTGWHTPGADPFMEAGRVIDAYREVCPVAEMHKVLLCIENHSSVNPDADGILAMIRAVGSPALRTNPDPTNFIPDYATRPQESIDALYGMTERFSALMANAHLKIGEFKPDGEHQFVSVRQIVEIFRRVGYDGHIVLEVERNPEQAPEICAQGLALLRKYL